MSIVNCQLSIVKKELVTNCFVSRRVLERLIKEGDNPVGENKTTNFLVLEYSEDRKLRRKQPELSGKAKYIL